MQVAVGNQYEILDFRSPLNKGRANSLSGDEKGERDHAGASVGLG